MHRTFQFSRLAETCLLLAGSFVGARYLKDQPLHHVPTVLALALPAWLAWKRRISDASLTAVTLFVWLHILDGEC